MASAIAAIHGEETSTASALHNETSLACRLTWFFRIARNATGELTQTISLTKASTDPMAKTSAAVANDEAC